MATCERANTDCFAACAVGLGVHWWFDSPYSLDPRAPSNSVTTDLRGFRFPW